MINNQKKRERNKVFKQCVICGEDFTPITSAVTCSEKCGEVRARQMATREYANDKGTPTVCVVCGEEFLGRHGRKVCSQKCKEERGRQYYRKKADYQKEIECEWCGKKFKRVHKQKFCGDECRQEHVREYNRIKKREQRAREARERGEEVREYRDNKPVIRKGFDINDYEIDLG